jgi:hypothetical protein
MPEPFFDWVDVGFENSCLDILGLVVANFALTDFRLCEA